MREEVVLIAVAVLLVLAILAGFQLGSMIAAHAGMDLLELLGQV